MSKSNENDHTRSTELLKLTISIHNGNITDEQKEKIEGIRTFISRLIEQNNTYLTPLWKGLYEIK